MGYKTRRSPGCFCRALHFLLLSSGIWDTGSAYMGEYPIPADDRIAGSPTRFQCEVYDERMDAHSCEECQAIYRELMHAAHKARQSLFEYIEVFYNRERRHSALGYQSPCQYEEAA